MVQLQNTPKIQVILISSVTPSPHSAGQIILQRHLVDEPEVDLQVLHTEPQKRSLRKLLRSVLGRLGRTKLHPFCQDALAIWRGGWIDGELSIPFDTGGAKVVMTVAHGDAYYAAMRFAQLHNLPLVTFFHDWWPDVPHLHKPFRLMLESSFRQLYKASTLALCVSSGMKKELGPHLNARVLYPISASSQEKKQSAAEIDHPPYRLLYSGNIKRFGPMLMDALAALKDHPNIRLEVRGQSESWPDSIRKEMGKRGLLLSYASREEFNSWIKTADAFLITHSFDEKQKRLMQTNFPSKLVEFAQLGKPLIIWGPAYASGPAWAGESGQALAVNDKDPDSLKQSLEQLFENMEKRQDLVDAAHNAASGCFDPLRIQSKFMEYLRDVAK